MPIKSPIKIIATDLDGTLMMPNHTTVSPRTIKALNKAHDYGVIIAIATGRTHGLIHNVIEQIPFCDYLIFSNGATVVDLKTNEFIYTNWIESKIKDEVIDCIQKYKVFYEVYINGSSVVQKDKSNLFDGDGFNSGFLNQIIENIKLVDDIKEELAEKDIEKINVFSSNKTLLTSLREDLMKMNTITISSALVDDIEIVSKTANKGEALRGIAGKLNIVPAEIMAFGDAGNDIKMLQYADFSFAMANGTDECKQSAKYLADSNANDGLAKVVEKYVLK